MFHKIFFQVWTFYVMLKNCWATCFFFLVIFSVSTEGEKMLPYISNNIGVDRGYGNQTLQPPVSTAT